MLSRLFAYALVPLAHADDFALKLENPATKASSVPALITLITSWLVKAAVVIVPIFIIIGAFQILTSAGNAEKYKTGQKTILYAIIGFVIVLLAQGIADIIKKALTV